MKCRHCHSKLEFIFIDLGFAPPSNAYLSLDDLNKPELTYPLRIFVCEKCWLVQTEDFAKPNNLFDSSYAYFSSTSNSLLNHAKEYYEMICKRLLLNENNYVVEIASNDGYLLRNFVNAGLPCLGIEPTESTAKVAEKFGIPVYKEFFGEKVANNLASDGKQADLIIANNVYAHVPDINGFTKGLKSLLKPGGTITLEFSSLMEMVKNCLFDLFYHEHYSYLSLNTVRNIFGVAGLKIIDVENLSQQGGSLRVYGCHIEDKRKPSSTVKEQLAIENEFGLFKINTYKKFQILSEQIKNDLIYFLIEKKRNGAVVGAYGAAAKGNTLLNYSGIKPDLLPWVCDAASSKQGKFLPGSHIPIYSPEYIKVKKPDFLLILPWNISREIEKQLEFVNQFDTKFVTALPRLKIS